MENEPVEFEDEALDRWTDEDAVLFEINKETQMWRVFRAMMLRMEGKLEMAKAEFDMAIASAHVVTVTMAARLGLAHIKLEQLQTQNQSASVPPPLSPTLALGLRRACTIWEMPTPTNCLVWRCRLIPCVAMRCGRLSCAIANVIL